VEIGFTFGGITVSSLLIDQEGHVYPTDMSSITRSHILEDFVSIECDFRFNMHNSGSLVTLWDFEKQLSDAASMNTMLPAGNVEPEYRKALVAIQIIRKLAAEMTGDSLVPYLVGLFHYTIRPLYFYDPQLKLAEYQVRQMLHRLMSAALMLVQVQRQAEIQDGLIADDNDNNELKINEASRGVSIGSRKVQLTQTEFRLLLYLHKNPNRLCSREEILAEVFDIKGSPTTSDRGLLNTHIDRLRKKIELNPAKHHFIVTIRGEGYLFDQKT
jgi:DNA-binding winged helix-turn-helix (wHTH) protein